MYLSRDELLHTHIKTTAYTTRDMDIYDMASGQNEINAFLFLRNSLLCVVEKIYVILEYLKNPTLKQTVARVEIFIADFNFDISHIQKCWHLSHIAPIFVDIYPMYYISIYIDIYIYVYII